MQDWPATGDEEVVNVSVPLLQLPPHYMDTDLGLTSNAPSPELLQTPSGLWYTHRTLLVSPLIRLTTQPQSSAQVTHHFARLGFIIERHSPLIESLSDQNVLTLPTDPQLLTPQQAAVCRDEIQQTLAILTHFLQQSSGQSGSISSSEAGLSTGAVRQLANVQGEIPSFYDHMMPKHGSRIVEEGKWQEAAKKGGIIYDKGRITTLDYASSVTGIKLGTLHNYLSDKKLTERGRIFVRGGKKVLIDLDELDSVLSSRKPGGRPRKTPESDEKVVEPKLITLKEAVETHGVAYETLRSWYRSGHLPERGREVFATHGGGKILVDEKDVVRLKSQPPRRGKPPIKPTQ
jgi:hypothetical protein